MPVVNLTDRFCQSAKSGEYFDEITTGLALRVTPKGHRGFAFHFTSPEDGKRARLTLGSYPATSLATARTLVMESRGHVESGMDPRDVDGGQRATAMTVADLCSDWLRLKVRAEGYRSAAAIERRINANIVSVIGTVRLSEFHRRDAVRVTDRMLERGATVEALRAHEHLRAMTRWATGRGIFDHDPLAALNSPATVKARDRVLSEHEIATLWHRLPEVFQRPATRLALMLILVTGQRPGEVAGMAKTEIDLAARLWRLPAERSKNKRPHDIPLSDTAIAIIREAIEASGENPHVFPMRDGRPMDSNNLGERVRDTQACFGLANWTPHDLRRTALTHMGKLGISPLVRAHVANHRTVTKAGVTLGVYDHYDYGAEKRQALDLWAERLQAIIGGKGAEVIPMNTRA